MDCRGVPALPGSGAACSALHTPSVICEVSLWSSVWEERPACCLWDTSAPPSRCGRFVLSSAVHYPSLSLALRAPHCRGHPAHTASHSRGPGPESSCLASDVGGTGSRGITEVHPTFTILEAVYIHFPHLSLPGSSVHARCSAGCTCPRCALCHHQEPNGHTAARI